MILEIDTMACQLEPETQWLVDVLSEAKNTESDPSVRKIIDEYYRWITTERPSFSQISKRRSIERRTLSILLDRLGKTDNDVYSKLN